MNQQIIIVGGGAIGLSLAWELSKRDRAVTLLDQQEVGRATSWAAVGILPPANLATAIDSIDRLRGLSHELYPHWSNQLQQITSIDPGYRVCGGWYLADRPGERASMVGLTEYWNEMAIACTRVDLPTLAQREPAMKDWTLRSPKASAWWTPEECQIRSPDFLKALKAACLGSGVQIVEHFDVSDVVESKSGVEVIGRHSQLNSTGTFKADAAVVSAGPWTGQIASSLRLDQSIVPIRGQVILFKTDQPLFRAVVNVGNRYLVSRDDGCTLVGSCEEEVGWQPGTTDPMLDSLREFAFDVCPALRQAPEVRSWSGLRPMTFDGFPMIGRVPDSDRLYVASGHYRSGLHLAPATAVVLSDFITDVSPAIQLENFSVGKQQTKTLGDGAPI
ncbi:NAD(P)/FAD-dependent oxidoreductase [Planctomycetes bacterium K23_9]|uniref:Glycine oxidase n=1 Tax=Stieleria marina TaxID=1930275 RepID=A0A517NN87_9BACT|nr:Glycine oxidase [Planctomycetes bacterium K23_9]